MEFITKNEVYRKMWRQGTTSVDPKFQEDILNHFREDDIGMICVKDQTIIRFGVSLWLKNSKKMERKGVMAEMKRRLGRMLMKMKSLTNDDTLKSVKIEEESREETLHWSHHGSRHQNLPQKKRRRKNQQDPACFADKCKLNWNVMLFGNINPTNKSVLLCNFQRQNKHVL